MRVLLIKPNPDGRQFGLAPFFQTEPLGLEYVAGALEARGHETAIADLRFHNRPIEHFLKKHRPALVGIACPHILDAPASIRLARRIKAFSAGLFVVVGGHAASTYPAALADSRDIDAVAIGEGERLLPAVCDAICRGRALEEIPSLLLQSGSGGFHATPRETEDLDLVTVRPPDRSKVARYRKNYCCLNCMPVWTLETSRGCLYRCKFCSVWEFHRGARRFHPPSAVRKDFERTGPNVFVIDDLFWSHEAESRELAGTLLTSPKRKEWMLVQTRGDLVARNPDLLELWRPLSGKFDIFFGFESPADRRLTSLNKGAKVAETIRALEVARSLDYGITGNFIVDPDFTERDFAAILDFMHEHRLNRVGFTILTPLPGTRFFEQMKDRLSTFDWNQYDLHHLLWTPRLPVVRFFELYCGLWRHSILNLRGRKKLWDWIQEVRFGQIPRLARILRRTQNLMNPRAYLAEARVEGPATPAAAVRRKNTA